MPNSRDEVPQEDIPDCWSTSAAKRVFDLLLASAALIVVSPLIVLTAIVVRISSRGPVIFRQKRIGMHDRPFQIFKFRTMRLHPVGSGPSVTTANDERLTAVGRILRRTKLDEIPQLLNVVLGDMSFVGPRPKVPHHQVFRLHVRPGITGVASLAFCNEEHMLHGIPSHELDNVQVNVLMPTKRALDESYVLTATLSSDIALMFRTVYRSAKSADAHRQTRKELARPWGGALDTVPVLREFLKSAKGADARRQTVEELASPWGGAPDTATVLRELLKRSPAPEGQIISEALNPEAFRHSLASLAARLRESAFIASKGPVAARDYFIAQRAEELAIDAKEELGVVAYRT
jgi:lipopolysaccharide/colanic/teichoic acid biosynthesis glycosyltransferase